ncbi:GumC family protein [Adhaeribacter radiodurans]|uniref:non-specific protein-tyrosine kinase n=1 Tax=Adhaeribacter radiodurans TaxID=2745197 RepID=A0A7L7L3M7_9BACT|nr:tyrosine-protein kinase [Adhaeribacter radiodurans]QMU27422.1 polysaccharide biosynthesis tyrosine autokinase [Adhaeribacter radiodurans]
MNSEKIESNYIKKVLFSYLNFWYLFVLGGVFGLIGAYISLRYTTPQYSITTTLLIKDDKNGQGLSESSAFSDLALMKSSKNIDNEIVVLQSNSLMQRVLYELDFQTSYFKKGRFLEQEIYGSELPIKIIINKLNDSAFNKSINIYIKNNNSFEIEDFQNRTVHKFGQRIQMPYGTFTVVATSTNSAPLVSEPIIARFQDIRILANIYAAKLNVSKYNTKASALVLSITDAVPQKGIDVINKLLQVYNKEEVDDKNIIASRTISFIDERLKYLTAELSNVEKDVEKYKRQNDLTNVSSQAEQYLVEASDYNKQVAELAIEQDVLESIENYLNQQNEKYQLVPSSLTIQDPTLVGLITRFNELQIEREQLIRINRSDNPLIQNINNQLANLRVNILENLKNIKKSKAITHRNLQLKSGQFSAKIQQVPVVERQLIEITRQQEIKQAIYLYLLQKREESALSLAATVSNGRIVDPPKFSGPVSPNATTTYLYYLLLGLILPFLGVYIKNVLNNKVQKLQEVQVLTSVPILGEIAHNKGGNSIVVKEKSRTPIAEMFRLILANLQFSNFGKESKVLLVTSSMSGEGKTFFSINLGISLASTAKKIIILSFDLRKPSLFPNLGLSEGKGLSNYLISDTLLIDDIIQPTVIMPNLFVIGSGTIPPNPYELMLSSRMGHLFQVLKANFDYIIVDTPPVGQVADAYNLAPFIDSTIYLIRYNYTFKEQINIINDIYLNKKLNQPMLVLNDAKVGDTYGYGYAYTEQKRQHSFLNRIRNIYS